MATLRNRRGLWYARVKWYVKGIKYQKEKLIPLKTESKVIARERLRIVNKVESDIKEGMEFTFPWISNNSSTELKRFTLSDAITTWMKSRENKIRNNTKITNEYGLHYLKKTLGGSIPLRSINNNHISNYISYLESLGLSVTSINIHLRTVKAMMRFFERLDKLDKMPVISQERVTKKDPHYITDHEFEMVMMLDWLESFYKNLFIFYRDTGVRLREPFIARLNGNWMDIPSESKSHTERHISLSPEQVTTFLELRDWLNNGYGKYLKDPGNHISRKFKKALRGIKACEDKHFHSLRHTYAVRSLLRGVSIYDVKLAMGHASVTTTEVYSNMNLMRVAYDFPSLKIELKNNKRDTDMRDTITNPSVFMQHRLPN